MASDQKIESGSTTSNGSAPLASFAIIYVCFLNFLNSSSLSSVICAVSARYFKQFYRHGLRTSFYDDDDDGDVIGNSMVPFDVVANFCQNQL